MYGMYKERESTLGLRKTERASVSSSVRPLQPVTAWPLGRVEIG